MHKDNDGLSVADVGAMLDWLQHGPPLLQPPPGVGLFDELLVARPKLEQLAPEVHRRYLSQADQRLGKLFELLCRALIEQQPHLSILAHNLVMQKQRTLFAHGFIIIAVYYIHDFSSIPFVLVIFLRHL